MSAVQINIPPIAEVRRVSSPVTFEINTGNRSLTSLEPPDDGSPQVRGWRERTMASFDERTGLVSIESEYGTFSYYWPPAYRGRDLFTFLASLDFDYFMNKAAKQPYREIDMDKTLAELRRELIEERRRGDVEKQAARDRWDALNDLEGEQPMTEDGFFRHWWDDTILYQWWAGDTPPIVSRDKHCARHFWDVIWKTLITSPEFREHMTPKAAAA